MATSNDLNISQSGYVAFDGTSTFSGRTFQQGTGISITNANGVSGNTMISTNGAQVANTITGNDGIPLSPSSGNWNIFGTALSSGTNASVTSGSGSTLTITSINCAKWIVDPTANRGTHQTITAALAAASSGETIFIRPGTYTENITLKAGVNLTSFSSESSQNATGHVIISGTCTFTAAGSVTISGIQLQTNSAALLAVTGSAASIVNLDNCYLNCTNNTGITFSTSSASARINMSYCRGDLGTTGIALFSHSSSGSLYIIYSDFTNSGGSTTVNTASAGAMALSSTLIRNPITTSGTNSCGLGQATYIDTSTQNATCFTSGGSGTHTITQTTFISGTASAISISNTNNVSQIVVSSTNTNAITGAGTILLGDISFINTSNTINTTTQTARVTTMGTWRSPLQPCFCAYKSANTTNATGDLTAVTVICDSETFDQSSNYNNANGIFTAPITGKYMLVGGVKLGSLSASFTSCVASIVVTSNTTTLSTLSPGAARDVNNEVLVCGSAIINMTAGDTASLTVTVGGGTKTVSVRGDGLGTYFRGFMIC